MTHAREGESLSKSGKDMMTERDRINSINYAKWEGVQEGKQQAQREIAIAMKTKDIDTETIASCTGLSVEEVEAL